MFCWSFMDISHLRLFQYFNFHKPYFISVVITNNLQLLILATEIMHCDWLWLYLCHLITINISQNIERSLTSCCPPTRPSIAQTDLDIQGSHAHHACMRSSCTWTTNGEVHGETVMHNNVKRCLHKWLLISVAIEAAMLRGQHDVTWKRSILGTSPEWVMYSLYTL